MCHAQELGSYAQGQGHNHVRGQIVPEIVFKVTARDQDHYKGPSGAFVTYCNIFCFSEESRFSFLSVNLPV